MKPVVLRSKFARVFGWALWGVLAASTTMIGFEEGGWAFLQTLAVTATVGILIHELLVKPKIEIDEYGVRITNPLRTFVVQWGAIERIDTKWGLALYTARIKVQAWSAPAPGRHSSLRSTKFDGKHLPESTYLAGTIRPGDLVSSDSGAAAYAIRHEWERRRDLNLLETAADVIISWHKPAGVAILVSLLAAVLLNLN